MSALSLPYRRVSSGDGIVGERSLMGLPEESPASKGQPRALEQARVGWPPY
jgi:hypothetical protein